MSNKQAVKQLKSIIGFVPTFNEFLRFDSHQSYQVDDILGINVNAEELFWQNTGKKLVFANKDVVQMLGRAKFSAHADAKILPPEGFETFALCFERDTYIEAYGQKIRLYPCQITVLPAKAMAEKIHEPFHKLTGYQMQENDELELAIIVSYKAKGATYRSCVDVSEAIRKVDTEGLPESAYLSDFYDQRLNSVEQMTINALMKVALQLLIFNAATDNKYLSAGYPTDGKFKLPKNATRDDWTASHFSYKPMKPIDPAARICPAHFRNLRHEKYYQGQFAHYTPKSRWTIVSEYFTGDNETYTQTKD
ncbi:hypothetical protein [Vibrio owensii]|uniref:hypothetical protein n=1 Tax=Vibrio harveyi group TaxID=717610 RepID=UPI003CC5DCCB